MPSGSLTANPTLALPKSIPMILSIDCKFNQKRMGKQTPGEGRKIYRLSLVEDRTHEQIGSVRFTRVKLVAGLVSFAVITVLLLYALIALTPLRTTIPGYPDAHFRKQAINNAIRIDSLENSITRWKLYVDNLTKVIAGEQTLDLDSMMSSGVARYISDKAEAELAASDSMLRAAAEKEEHFGVSSSAKPLPIEGMQFFSPIKGVVSKPYDKVLHPAVDITAPANSVVCSVLDGTVIFAGWSDDYGYVMQIQHPGNIVSSYSHNEKLLKSAGDKVTAGTPIAIVGSTENVDHLHFELWYSGDAVDPGKYINF